MKILSDYWRQEKHVINMGDYLTPLLIRYMGYDFVPMRGPRYPKEFDTCVWVIGTLLDHWWLGKAPLPVTIWGCGWSGDDLRRNGNLSKIDPRLVRGPLSQKAIGNFNVPIGDPGLLTSELFPSERNINGPSIYIPHFNSRKVASKELDRMEVDQFLDVACFRDTFHLSVRNIGSASFVLTSSLHGAIIAQSYGVPWALTLPAGVKHDKPLKWRDWFASLGHNGLPIVNNKTEGIHWWKCVGSLLKTPNIQSIKNSFPHDAAR